MCSYHGTLHYEMKLTKKIALMILTGVLGAYFNDNRTYADIPIPPSNGSSGLGGQGSTPTLGTVYTVTYSVMNADGTAGLVTTVSETPGGPPFNVINGPAPSITTDSAGNPVKTQPDPTNPTNPNYVPPVDPPPVDPPPVDPYAAPAT
jgi:hypothetical protein